MYGVIANHYAQLQLVTCPWEEATSTQRCKEVAAHILQISGIKDALCAFCTLPEVHRNGSCVKSQFTYTGILTHILERVDGKSVEENIENQELQSSTPSHRLCAGRATDTTDALNILFMSTHAKTKQMFLRLHTHGPAFPNTVQNPRDENLRSPKCN